MTENLKKNNNLIGKIFLPSSKSISNRLLIIRFLCENDFEIGNLSNSDDTKILEKTLYKIKNSSKKDEFIKFNIGNSGTSIRFLTSLLSTQKGKFIIDCSERMKKRPIFIMVKALRELGADIEFLEKKNFFPLKIIGKNLISKTVEMDANISSQFISSLLLIAPILPDGLKIILNKKIVSSPYIDLTLSLLKEFGIKFYRKKNEISIKKGAFLEKNFFVESDWSSASYWYEFASFSENVNLEIYGLKEKSLQGDKIVHEIFKKFSIETFFKKNSIILKKNFFIKTTIFFKFDFSDCPDLVQTVVVTLCFLKIPFEISGLETLKYKESSRVETLQLELKKFGFILKYDGKILSWKINDFIINKNKNIFIETHDDHRIAMAFAPVILKNYNLKFNNPEVVNKSYPNFWKEIKIMRNF
ncbi:MAG: hypothetical protein B6I24_07450 [Bacteroidetes bacterium 4572_128]|nr:MAG: hypothetical protein B6I24_07450 [Bacteroidetes bacterium 4572_128]